MQVEHDPAGHRFYVELPVGSALLSYEPAGEGLLDFYSTYVPPAARGQGIADLLVLTAMEYARAVGCRVIPSCSYVAHWFREHPEHADLAAG